MLRSIYIYMCAVYMCACVHVCYVHVCMCTCVLCACVCVYMCAVYMCACVHVCCVHVCCVHVYMCAMYMYTCVHVYMCTCVHVCMCTCVHNHDSVSPSISRKESLSQHFLGPIGTITDNFAAVTPRTHTMPAVTWTPTPSGRTVSFPVTRDHSGH